MVKLYTIFDKELNQRMFYLMDNYRRVVVTSIDLDADKESASYGESVTFTAVVTDKDNNPVSGSTVSFYNINSRLGAAISNENGVATFSYVVRHDLSVNARADDVQSNTVAVTMDEDVYELVLSCDAPIIESGGSTSVNCLLTHNGGAVSGESLNYIINHGSTTIDSGSVTTGNDGTASISYVGTGVGDVSVEVSYSTLLQKTYELEDCDIYDTTEHTKSYSTTKFETIASITDLSDVSISLDLKTTTYNYSCVFGIGYNSESDQIGFGTTDTVGRIYRTLNGINNHLNYSQFNQNNVYYNLRFERTGNTLKTYLNNVLIDTSTDNEISTFTYLNFGSWRTKTIYYKNLKVKAL